MFIKQDFSNLLSKQVAELEKSVSLIQEEIEIRGQGTDTAHPLAVVQNKRAIVALENELRSKNEFLFKLKEKMLHDEPEIEVDYLAAVNGVENAEAEIKNVKDEEIKIMCEFSLSLLKMWIPKTDLPEHKEACGFYYKALKMSLRDAGIDI